MLSIKQYSGCHESWQSWDVFSQPGAHLCRPKACIGNDWRGIYMPASLQVPPPWLTVWTSAGSGVKQPLHGGHRLLYGCSWKINEGAEVNKAGFTSGSFISLSLHLQGVLVHFSFPFCIIYFVIPGSPFILFYDDFWLSFWHLFSCNTDENRSIEGKVMYI